MTSHIGKTKRRLQDRKREHFKALVKKEHTPAITDHIKATGRYIKWDHFEILASGKTDYHCKIKTLFIQELNPTLSTTLTSDKLSLSYVKATLSHTQISGYFYCI